VQEVEDAKAAALVAQGARGPAVELSSHRLLFDCLQGHSCMACVTLRATGCAAVYFAWSHARPEFPFPAVQSDEASAFYLPIQSGSILPGEEQVFTFLFKPHRAGMFTERWRLCVQPSATEMCGGGELVLRGMAVTQDMCVLGRMVLRQDLESSQKRRQVSAALERIVRSVEVPSIVHPPFARDAWLEHNRFAAGTASIKPPVYFHPGVGEKLESIFQELHDVLVPPPDPKLRLKKGEVQQQDAMPGAYDGRVDSLLEYVHKVSCNKGSVAVSALGLLDGWPASQ
jgi:hypothetical protein